MPSPFFREIPLHGKTRAITASVARFRPHRLIAASALLMLTAALTAHLSAADKKPTKSSTLEQANSDLRKRIELAAGILKGLDQRAKLAKQTVPQAGAILDNFSGLLSAKPPKHDGIAGGVFWRLSAVHWQLGQKGKQPGKAVSPTSVGGLSVDPAVAAQVQAVKTLALTHKIHDDILKLRKSADEGLGKAAKTLWGRNEKPASIALDGFRKESSSGLKKAADLLEDGLKACGSAQRKHFMGVASSSGLGMDLKPAASGRGGEGKGSGPGAASKSSEALRAGSAASALSAAAPSSAGGESLLGKGRGGALAVASAVGGLGARAQQTCPPGFNRKQVEESLARMEDIIRSSKERLASLERSLENWKSSSCGFPAKPCTEAISATESSIAGEKKNLASFESDKQRLLAQLSCVPGGGGGGGGGGEVSAKEKARLATQKADLGNIRVQRDIQYGLITHVDNKDPKKMGINQELKLLGRKPIDIRDVDGAAKSLGEAIQAQEESCKTIKTENKASCAQWKTLASRLKTQLKELRTVTDEIARLQGKIRDNKPDAPASKFNIADLANKTLSPSGEDAIKYYESKKRNKVTDPPKPALTKYIDDHGNPTIGWGHKLEGADEKKAKDPFIVIKGVKVFFMKKPLTPTQAEDLFKQDVAQKKKELNAVIGVKGGINKNVTLTQNQYEALLDLVFNVGVGNMEKAKKGPSGILNTRFLDALNRGDNVAAGEEIVSFASAGKDKKTGEPIIDPGNARRGKDRKDLWKAP